MKSVLTVAVYDMQTSEAWEHFTEVCEVSQNHIQNMGYCTTMKEIEKHRRPNNGSKYNQRIWYAYKNSDNPPLYNYINYRQHFENRLIITDTIERSIDLID